MEKEKFYVDEEKRYQGEWLYYFDDKIYAKGMYKDDIKIGLWFIRGKDYCYYL